MTALQAGVVVRYPEGISDLCCGNFPETRGFPAHAQVSCSPSPVTYPLKNTLQDMADRTLDALVAASKNGKRPIVVDMPSCAHRLSQLSSTLRFSIYESAEFIRDFLLPRLRWHKRGGKERVLLVHVPCSAKQRVPLGEEAALLQIAKKCCDEVSHLC